MEAFLRRRHTGVKERKELAVDGIGREQFVPGPCGVSEHLGGRGGAEERKSGGLVRRKAEVARWSGGGTLREKRSGYVCIADRHQKTLSLEWKARLWPCLMRLLRDCSGFLALAMNLEYSWLHGLPYSVLDCDVGHAGL